MADGETENDEPSLELPSLGLPNLGLRHRRKKAAPAPGPEPVEDTAVLPPALAPKAEAPPPPPPPPAPEPAEPPPLFVDEVEPVAGATEPTRVAVTGPPEPTRTARRFRGPGGMPATVLTGAVVGLGLVGLTWSGLKLCESVQGTSSCGGSGYPLLAAILVLMVVVGGLLLKVARVPDPGSTSFLAVGLTAVLALLFLVDSLLDTAMIVVIPLVSAASYALAHWVTRTFIEPAQD